MGAVRTVTLTPNVEYILTLDGDNVDYDEVAIFHTGNVADPVYANPHDVTPVPGGPNTRVIPSGVRRTIKRVGQTGVSDIRMLAPVGAVEVEVEFG